MGCGYACRNSPCPEDEGIEEDGLEDGVEEWNEIYGLPRSDGGKIPE